MNDKNHLEIALWLMIAALLILFLAVSIKAAILAQPMFPTLLEADGSPYNRSSQDESQVQYWLSGNTMYGYIEVMVQSISIANTPLLWIDEDQRQLSDSCYWIAQVVKSYGGAKYGVNSLVKIARPEAIVFGYTVYVPEDTLRLTILGKPKEFIIPGRTANVWIVRSNAVSSP